MPMPSRRTLAVAGVVAGAAAAYAWWGAREEEPQEELAQKALLARAKAHLEQDLGLSAAHGAAGRQGARALCDKDGAGASGAAWEALAADLPQLLRRRRARSAIDALPPLDWRAIEAARPRQPHQIAFALDHPLWRALALLVTAATAYVWQEVNAGVDEDMDTIVLPASLAAPLRELAQTLEVPPVATYGSTIMRNWRHKAGAKQASDAPLCAEQLEVAHSWSGSRAEEWFKLVTLETEARGGPCLHAAVALRMLLLEDNDGRDAEARVVAALLRRMARGVRDSTSVLGKFRVHCTPEEFDRDVRPWLGGSKDNPRLPRGLAFATEDGGVVREAFAGVSAAQSTLFAGVDLALGVRHEDPGAVLGDFRTKYSGAATRALLHELAPLGPRLRAWLAQVHGPAAKDARAAYAEAVQAVADFRKRHLAVVHAYILGPEKRKQQQQQGQQDQDEQNEEQDVAGTGGTGLLGFLRPLISETREALELPPSHK